MSALVRHLRSVRSRGPGYEPTPAGRNLSQAGVRGYYLDFRAKTTAPSAARPGELSPAALAQLALGWWERACEGDATAGDRFVALSERLADAGETDGEAVVWRYPSALPKFRLSAGWISGLSQSQAASVFVRAYLHTAEERFAGLAVRAIRPLLGTTAPSVVRGIAAGQALEECPSERPSLILNGWIYALWGLRDVAEGLRVDQAGEAYRTSLVTLAATLGQYDAGWWSRYSLYPFRRPDLAKLFYHRLHVDQLEVLATLCGEPVFREYATRWRAYDTPLNRCRVTVQKAAFVAGGHA